MLACLAMAAVQQPQTFLVTGSTDGIGKFTASKLAQAGHAVIVHGRNAQKVAAVAKEIGAADAFVADLSLMSEVRRLGTEVAAKYPKIDGLLNNCGTFDGDYTGKRVVTSEGNEYSLAVNVLAPFLLTSLLLASVRASGAGRILITSSISKGAADALDDLQCETRWDMHRAYSLSKLADAMLVFELHDRYGDAPRLVFNTMDPGTVNTKMLAAGWGMCGIPVSQATTSFKMLTDERWGAVSGEANGCGVAPQMRDPAARRALWERCVELTGAVYP